MGWLHLVTRLRVYVTSLPSVGQVLNKSCESSSSCQDFWENMLLFICYDLFHIFGFICKFIKEIKQTIDKFSIRNLEAFGFPRSKPICSLVSSFKNSCSSKYSFCQNTETKETNLNPNKLLSKPETKYTISHCWTWPCRGMCLLFFPSNFDHFSCLIGLIIFYCS